MLTFPEGAKESGLELYDSTGGEWGITATLQGNCEIHIIAAGGITYSWTV
jgi:hypothetical protein